MIKYIVLSVIRRGMCRLRLTAKFFEKQRLK